MKKRKVAIFDIDGTIFRSSLLIELVNEFIAEGIFPKKVEKSYLSHYKKWLDRIDSYEKYLDGVVKSFEKNIEGKNYSDFVKIGNKVNCIKQKRVYRYTRNLIRELKRKNYFLLAISNSPKELVQGFCKRMGFDKVYGRIYETDENNKFTGRILHLDLISDKSKVYGRVEKKENLTLNDSVGVGDTESDIPFLELVKHPICFNPNQKLYKYAKKKGWKIVVERKDVIYQF